jgi:hypothetical protein
MDVTFEAVLLPAVVFENALDLLLDLEDVWRQQALQPERGALGFVNAVPLLRSGSRSRATPRGTSGASSGWFSVITACELGAHRRAARALAASPG